MKSTTSSGVLLELRFSHSVPKSPDLPNEDHFAIDEARQLFALSDGASISFDSALWARLVSNAFLARPDLSGSWLDEARAGFESAHDFESMLWHEQAAFEQGSFATLLGLTVDPKTGLARFLATGDSVVVVLEDGYQLLAFPYDDVTMFVQDPELLSTNRAAPMPELTECTISLGEHPGHISVLMMTDALAAWCLERGQQGAEQLCAFLDQKNFEQFVVEERSAGRMRIDDATLLVLMRSALA